MVEPLHPDLRAALKAAHPGLTDAQIDQHEELLAQRFLLNPETQEAEIRTLDRRREELLQQYMPNYQQVAQMFHNRRAAEGESLRSP
jgi:hypothetical protein